MIGPLADFGGREIMTNLLANSLERDFDIQIVSTISMSKKSVALQGTSYSWDTINYFLFRKYPLLKFSATLTKIINSRKEPAYDFVKNRISKNIFNFEGHYYSSIFQFIRKSNCVIYSGEIDGKWFEELIKICDELKKPLVLNVTREINEIPNFLKKNNLNLNILTHSLSNNIKVAEINCKIWHIDQTTILEKDLLQLDIVKKQELVYGFLGRFSQEKGILELLDLFSKSGRKLVIAGNGPLLKDVQSYCAKHPNLVNVGQLSPQEVADFFSKIDVFIISSFEEGGPIVGVEAMAAGKLIVSTKVGAMAERLENTGNDFWFQIENKNTLNLALDRLELLSSIERKEIQIAVRNQYINFNSLNIIRTKYLEVFNEILVSS